MKRWELLIYLGLCLIGLWLFSLYRQSKSQPSTPNDQPQSSLTVNPQARLTANGLPLATNSPEDVVIEQQLDLFNNLFHLAYDHQTANWQLEFADNLAWRKIRYLQASHQFFWFNDQSRTWDQVDPDILPDSYLQLARQKTFRLSDQQLIDFHQLARLEEVVNCQQNENQLCALWQATNFIDQQQLLVYVNLVTRKIETLISFNPTADDGQKGVANYYYQPVEIGLPPADQIRWLPPEVKPN